MRTGQVWVTVWTEEFHFYLGRNHSDVHELPQKCSGFFFSTGSVHWMWNNGGQHQTIEPSLDEARCAMNYREE